MANKGKKIGTLDPNKPTNPAGANQYQLDPRQKLCWDFYANPKSETFGNATQSAIKAGYEEEYAKTITVTEWFVAKVRRLNMLDKAEKVLEEMLDLDTTNQKVIDGEVYIQKDAALAKIKQDTAKFIAERVGKNDGYSSRTEITGKDGEAIKTEMIPDDKFREILTAYANKPTRENPGT